MFIDSPELYDAIYHFKNYARECDRLRSLINEVVPGARTIRDRFLCRPVRRFNTFAAHNGSRSLLQLRHLYRVV
jgi:hypothetical protein